MHMLPLLAYDHLGVADHLVVQRVAVLHHLQDLAFQVGGRRRSLGDGFVLIGIEELSFGVRQ